MQVRSKNFEPPLDLRPYGGLSLRVRGDGQRYKMILRTDPDTGRKQEPYEETVIEVPTEYQGVVMEEMQKKSGEEQTSDDEAYAKFKSYCDDNTEEQAKTAGIDTSKVNPSSYVS